MPKVRTRKCADPECGKRFKPRKLAKGTSRYCSPKCLVASLNVSPSEQYSNHPIEADGTRKCARPECGDRFVPNESGGTVYYCSSDCAIRVFESRPKPVSTETPEERERAIEKVIRAVADAL